MPNFLPRSVKPARACQWACGAFFGDQAASEERNQSSARSEGPSSSGLEGMGGKLFTSIISVVPNVPGASDDSQLTVITSPDPE